MEKCNVFLGGTCAHSDWRKQLMPILDSYNITYFNPVVSDWTSSCQVIEDWHKEHDDFNLFVITSEMKGVFSITEVVDLSNKRPNTTIFCVLRDGFTKGQLKSLDATINLVKNNGAIVVDSIEDIASILNKKINDESEDIFVQDYDYVVEVRPDLPIDSKPEDDKRPTVFLAGTIDMGNSENWQKKTIQALDETLINCIVYNPRRETWPDDNSNEFERQVNWEQDMLEGSDIIFMYIAGTSKSPITLLELGEFLTSGKLIVVCEEDFYRYGNVRIMCERFGIPLYNDYEDGFKKLTLELKYLTHIYEDF